ncbi:MAG TPA: alpha/beta hydrolase [Planctomycetota bacterium]|nr:alpha/beta hydrolase [Planctomycetota bacterium]
MLHPILLVPGLLGSKLRCREELVWGSFTAALGWRSARLQLPLAPSPLPAPFTACGAVERMVRGIYARFLSRARNRIQIFAYDWRFSHTQWVEALRAELLRSTEPVCIVAHCTGGLLVDLALSSEEAAAKVHRVAFVGCPRGGTLKSFQCLTEGLRLAPIGIRFDPALLFTLPALFDALPDNGKVFGDRGPDLWDAQAWQHEGWGVFAGKRETALYEHLRLQLARGKAVRNAVNAALEWRGPPVRFYTSRSHATAAGAELTAQGIRFTRSEPGDGTVTASSATLRAREDEVRSCNAPHRYLLEDPELLDDLFRFLE